ncbi:MAG: ABC transporter substrate-binding protein [Deltaproteobacteria bacterium]|nr:ABC transporter substrate-binding protein [Deltaproteobacteria bacterium]
MIGIRTKNLLLICLLSFFLTLFFNPSSSQAAPPKGEVVYATSAANFFQVGGDPATHTAGFPVLARTIFDSLVYVNKEVNILPGLAKSWKIAPNWKTIDFMLRDDVTFHNGDKFTAEDVKFSLETYLRKELKYLFTPLWTRNIVKSEVVGPYHFRLHLNGPDPGFLGRLWWATGMMPQKYREQVGDKGFAEKPVGTGPYKWVEYKQDNYWKVEAVKKHFRHTPAIKTFKMVYVPEHATRLAMLKAGEADITNVIGPHTVEVKADPNLRLVLGKYTALTVLTFADLTFPKDPSPFHDIRVREAASLAVDREGITKKVLFGMSEPYGDFCSPITMGHDKNIKPDPYNPERAKKLLADAGYPKGFETMITVTPENRYWVEALVSNLNEVGIKTKIELMEAGPYVQGFMGKKFKGLLQQALWYHAEISAAADASDHFLSFMPYCYNTTPEIQKAIVEGNPAITNEELKAAGIKISKAIRESRNKVFLWANHVPYGLGPRIEYWEPEVGAIPASAFEMIRLKKQYQ